jgi:predicted nucleic acid-binding protein
MKSGVLVIDASAGIALVREEPFAAEVSRLLHERRAKRHRLLVPWLFWIEVVNVLGRRYRADPALQVQSIAELDAAGLETIELDRPMLLLTLDAVARLGLTAYDAVYLALAETSDAELLTADGILAAAAGERALLVGDGRTIREQAATYRVRDVPTWAAWPGAAAYLRELRARLVTGSPS